MRRKNRFSVMDTSYEKRNPEFKKNEIGDLEYLIDYHMRIDIRDKLPYRQLMEFRFIINKLSDENMIDADAEKTLRWKYPRFIVQSFKENERYLTMKPSEQLDELDRTMKSMYGQLEIDEERKDKLMQDGIDSILTHINSSEAFNKMHASTKIKEVLYVTDELKKINPDETEHIDYMNQNLLQGIVHQLRIKHPRVEQAICTEYSFAKAASNLHQRYLKGLKKKKNIGKVLKLCTDYKNLAEPIREITGKRHSAKNLKKVLMGGKKKRTTKKHSKDYFSALKYDAKIADDIIWTTYRKI